MRGTLKNPSSLSVATASVRLAGRGVPTTSSRKTFSVAMGLAKGSTPSVSNSRICSKYSKKPVEVAFERLRFVGGQLEPRQGLQMRHLAIGYEFAAHGA